MWKEGRRYDDMHICVLMLRNKAMYNIVLVGKYIWDVLSSFPHPFACTWWLFCHSYTDLFFTVAHCYCWNFYVLLLLTVTLFTFFHRAFERIWPTRCSGFGYQGSAKVCAHLLQWMLTSYIFRNDFTLEWCRPSRIETVTRIIQTKRYCTWSKFIYVFALTWRCWYDWSWFVSYSFLLSNVFSSLSSGMRSIILLALRETTRLRGKKKQDIHVIFRGLLLNSYDDTIT